MLAHLKGGLFLLVKNAIEINQNTTNIQTNKKFYYELKANENTKSYTYEKSFLLFW